MSNFNCYYLFEYTAPTFCFNISDKEAPLSRTRLRASLDPYLVRSRRSNRHSTDSCRPFLWLDTTIHTLLLSVPLTWHNESNTKLRNFPQRYFQLPISCLPDHGHSACSILTWKNDGNNWVTLDVFGSGSKEKEDCSFHPFPEKWGEIRRWG